ncbi:hypothetical protein [Pseudonocardia charpentierae]|uniref:Uncharacterized protein n=1 Tax=Pseudonocardia charpentierae TaxID=3075545 RepID=A0ABU2NIY4_9PSEU|nr:hypothetical protein [Pseudonocardia sp. DSM 45834]MDT0353532.1 hypothetical protein [Pseudonocardia sp. DSM 45834]
MDRLANRHRFPPDLLLHFTAHYRGGPGTTRLCATLAHTNPYAGSPMESRLRDPTRIITELTRAVGHP